MPLHLVGNFIKNNENVFAKQINLITFATPKPACGNLNGVNIK